MFSCPSLHPKSMILVLQELQFQEPSRLPYLLKNSCFFFLFFFFLFFFLFSFTSLSSFFTHIETNQSVGGAKTGVPGEKPTDTPASRTWLVSHMNSCPVRGANPHRCDDRMIKSTEVSDLNHSATGAAKKKKKIKKKLL